MVARQARPVPETAPGSSRLRVVPDLTIEVGDARGSTVARMTGGGADGEVVLDVDDLVTLVRCLPPTSLLRDLPVNMLRPQRLRVPVRLTSQGRDLGRIRLDARGRARYRASPRGVVTAGRIGLASLHPGARTLLAGLGVTGILFALAAAARRAGRG